ncbi:TrmH family RNA methyltransferase [Eubacterium ruminantium]|uniref:TrmH family RNA methyltransferase n=1 Tax=Eubacterium ruminantium TaxID=42322 RepID=UPI0015686230|nr:RNA methyltransferase [Eubacterium ruminantium]
MNIINIKDLNDERLSLYAQLSENQLRRYFEPEPGVFVAESPNVIERALNAGYEPLSFLVETEAIDKEAGVILEKVSKIYGKEKAEEIPVFAADFEVLKSLTGFPMVRGLLAVMRRKVLSDIDIFCEGKKNIAVLYDIENPSNVGTIFRSAAALGIDGIILTKGSSDPLYRRAARVSMGTVFQIPWTIHEPDKKSVNTDDRDELMLKLADRGFVTAAMALSDNSVNITDENFKNSEKKAIILGNEGKGLPENVIRSCNNTLKIPMFHEVDSLNVGIAAAIVFWEINENKK